MFASTVHLAVVEAERHRDLERQRLVRAALAAQQDAPGRRPALRSLWSFAPLRWSFAPRRWFGRSAHVASRGTGLGAGNRVPACC
jgi:hypothetical protein